MNYNHDHITQFYRNVPKLGNVAVSRHAQKHMEESNIYQEAFERALLTPVKPDVRRAQTSFGASAMGYGLSYLRTHTVNRRETR